ATLGFVLVFNFFLFRAVGDPKKDLYRVPNQTFAQRQQLIHERGLDRSTLRQFVIYVEDTLQGQLETSYYTRRPVLDQLAAALPNTILLVLPATVIATLVGTWLGIIASSRRGSRVDAGTTIGSLTLWSAPPFWLGMIFITIFAVQLGAFPTGLK